MIHLLALSLAPFWIDFGRVYIPGVVSQEVRVSSQYEHSGLIEVNTHGCCGFRVSKNSCEILKPGQNCRFEAQFRPTFVGNYSCTITVSDSAGNYSELNVYGYGQ